jgi:hypothetical protein
VKGHNTGEEYLTGKPFGILRAVSSAERPHLLRAWSFISPAIEGYDV